MSGHRVAVIVSVVAAAVAAVTISVVFLVLLQNQNLLTIFATNSSNRSVILTASLARTSVMSA